MTDQEYFAVRFSPDPRRRTLWTALYRYYFKPYIRPDASVLDLGCGYGDFINVVDARRRIAVDRRADLASTLDAGVEGHVGTVSDLSFLESSAVEVALASNIFEHLTQETLRDTLAEIARVLTPTGTLFVIQPNYYYAYRQYFDDYTHVAVYSHISLCDVIRSCGYDILECVPRFMPLTIKSKMPVSPLLIRLYLALPWRPLAGQMLIRCRPSGTARPGGRRD